MSYQTNVLFFMLTLSCPQLFLKGLNFKGAKSVYNHVIFYVYFKFFVTLI